MAFHHLDRIEEREPVAGFRARFVHAETMTVAYWNITADSILPEHTHPHEQIVNVMGGELELTVEGEALVLPPGSVVTLAPGVPHSGRAVTDCSVIDIYHPVREDYR
jgi:quercetin dioxygenase-like cupin family protein